MFWIVMFLAQAAAVPSQTERGEALFLDAQQGCARCHALKGKGTAVGPDLTGLGRLAPQAIAMAARSTVTQYVQVVKLKSGGSFPAMTGKKDEKIVVLFDLSKNPPEKKEVAPTDIASMGSNDVGSTRRPRTRSEASSWPISWRTSNMPRRGRRRLWTLPTSSKQKTRSSTGSLRELRGR
jgi:mono/diheme cytochrome c family protein